MLDFCDFIQVFVFTTNHHLKTTFQINMIQTNIHEHTGYPETTNATENNKRYLNQ